ncbi:MAG TPA: hypothetical protein VK486_12365 [Thermoleophilaceae bacterium]|nr:hypothetical protein [Thermoleophilaceae bacterium]
MATAQDGDVITLDSTVGGTGGLCTGEYFLKNFGTAEPYNSWTLQGDPSDGNIDGFDGGTGSGLPGSTRMLTGLNVHHLEILDLRFRDGNVTGNGGAIDITGQSSVGLRRSQFFNNHATVRGGAVHLGQQTPSVALGAVGVSDNTFGSQTIPAEGNSAATGGALSIESPGQGNNNSGINGSTFANNTATGNGGGFDYALAPGGIENFSLGGNVVVNNKAGGSGGGAHVVVGISTVYVDNELYQGNSVEPMLGSPPGPHRGGGLWLEGDGYSITHRNDVYRGNSVKSFGTSTPVDYHGGGLAVTGAGLTIHSQFSRFESNSLPPVNVDRESRGGGLYVAGGGTHWNGFLDAIAGNAITGTGPADSGEGGGVFIDGIQGTAILELAEVSVAGNSVPTLGQDPGIAGGGGDTLIMRNSIVYNSPQPDIHGFNIRDVQYSDACQAGAPFSGPGNICADPKLVGGSDVHQTPLSPTIDKGGDQLLDAEGGGERNMTDYEGDPRPTDGDGDGHTTDMGADESPAGFVVQQPPPPPPTPQCSDGADNDGDGAIDSADPGCLAGPTDNNEGDETPGDLILCGQRTISLVRADVKGSKVVLSGVVATSLAGQKVQLTVRYLGQTGKPQKLGSVTPGADGQFQARVKKPSKRLFNDARYRAQVGSAKSVELKLPQSLASSPLKQVAGGMLELRGQVDRAVLGKRNPVVIKRILCGRYTAVGQAKPNKKGAYVVRFPSPPSQGSALYRAETKVLARPGSKRYVKQFARAVGITF